MSRSIFPPWTNSVARTSVVLLVGSPIGLVLLLMAWVRTPYVTNRSFAKMQPIPFDHRHHVRDDGIDCLYCHTDADRSPTAGYPSTADCMGCHGQIWNDSPLLEPLHRSAATGAPIVWERVHELPDFVFFDHAIHVNRGVGCVSCHGRVDRMAAVYQAEPMLMGWCLECHRDPAGHVRPLDRVTDMEWDPPNREAIGRQVVEELALDPPTFCTGCHR